MENDVTDELVAIVKYLSNPDYIPQTATEISFNLCIPYHRTQGILTYLQKKGCIRRKPTESYTLIERIKMYPIVIELIAKNILKI